ncbi:short-subunit dehydrogenase [Promicromonospora sp. AC04]|uniref:SDR family NAD(P)-dependent oxidoreductase n=1 Tax=Promicromonospora sp. AC04 TaxID=2135723 RepID=UPI000D351B7B|nr:SDR family NAD(P)-dependent oxidoreductase [Promicromonospora sp. AC04]PUB21571.1 short-subunit dehydrogenase [Promicromonospora sp. AC04]
MTTTRVIALTGATDGLGRALAERLADRRDHLLILHGRSPERLARLRADLRDRAADVVTVRADLSEVAQVHALATQISAVTGRLDVLVNNAGVGGGEPDGVDRRLTADGNELRLAVNYLAPFALTRDLLPLLRAGAPARVVNVASIGQSPIDVDDLTMAHGYSGTRAYGRSKLALIADGFTLASELPAQEVTVNSLHPGTYMPTKMVLESVGHSIDSLESGVEATLRLIEDPALEGVTGRFYDGLREARAMDDAYRPELRERLRAVSEELCARR